VNAARRDVRVSRKHPLAVDRLADVDFAQAVEAGSERPRESGRLCWSPAPPANRRIRSKFAYRLGAAGRSADKMIFSVDSRRCRARAVRPRVHATSAGRGCRRAAATRNNDLLGVLHWALGAEVDRADSSARSVASEPRSVSDDTITTGIGRSRISFSMKSRPSICGISISSVSTSGSVARIISRATSGLGAAPTTVMSRSRENISVSSCRTSAESSTIRTYPICRRWQRGNCTMKSSMSPSTWMPRKR
jgi:hypothetical protein